MEYIKNLRAFKLTYFGATNTKSSRVKIRDCRFNKTKFVNMSYDFMSMKDDAIRYLKELGINILYSAELEGNKDVLLTNDFEVQIK